MGLFGLTLARIDGQSMEPGLPSGSFALFQKRRRYQKGDTVLVQHPRLGRIVKEVAARTERGFLLKGTSPASPSTATLGLVPGKALLGTKIWAVAPKSEPPHPTSRPRPAIERETKDTFSHEH